MANLTVLLATFFALLFLADASIYRTTVSIDDEIENTGTSQSCRQQVQMQQNLRQCQVYFMRELRGRSRYVTANDENEYQFHHQDPFRGCCNQLQRMDAQCRCDGLLMAIRQQRIMGQLGSHEAMGAARLAQNLPYRCGVSPRQCRFSSQWME